MDAENARLLSERIRRHLFEHILPFWCGAALDHERGGWMAWLSNDLRPDRTQPKGLIVNTRILWTFSAVSRLIPEPLYHQMAERALDVVLHRFWDAQLGGAFWQLTDDWRVLDDSKKTYGQAFCIYALVEHHRAFREPASLARAQELFELVERNAHDGERGGYWEVRKRDWSEAGPEARLSDKDQNEKKSMNCHLHVLEAYTNLYRAWRERRVAERLRELIALFLQKILDPVTHHFHHFFDDAWTIRSDSYTYGHDIEGSWLLCEAAQALGDVKALRKTKAIALEMAEAVWREGLDADGGLRYEGRKGAVVDAGKEGWPQAEAIVGFLNAFQISGETKYVEAASRTWDYIEQHLVDRIQGEWYWRIDPNGLPNPTLPKVSEWKGPYHASRSCLEALRLLNVSFGRGETSGDIRRITDRQSSGS